MRVAQASVARENPRHPPKCPLAGASSPPRSRRFLRVTLAWMVPPRRDDCSTGGAYAQPSHPVDSHPDLAPRSSAAISCSWTCMPTWSSTSWTWRCRPPPPCRRQNRGRQRWAKTSKDADRNRRRTTGVAAMTTSIAPMRTVSACRWSRPGYRVSGVPEEFQPETRWVCARTDDRRSITAEECERCPYWEAGSTRRLQ